VQDLGKVKGLGPAKRAEIAAVLEIARRSLNQQLTEKPAMNDVGTVKTFLRLQLGGLGHEVFAVLFLDAQLRLIAMETLFQGSLTHTTVHPARGRQAGARPGRRRSHPRPQPPQRCGRALARR
jgi:DNA repair protein RadC